MGLYFYKYSDFSYITPRNTWDIENFSFDDMCQIE